MNYTIKATGKDTWILAGEEEDLLVSHLIRLMGKHGVVSAAWSESHAIHLLAEEAGVKVHLIDEDGELVEY